MTKNQRDVTQFRRFYRSLITQYVDLSQMLARQGASLRIMGVTVSPSCGVATTSGDYSGGQVRECEHAGVAWGRVHEGAAGRAGAAWRAFPDRRGRQEIRAGQRFLSGDRAILTNTVKYYYYMGMPASFAGIAKPGQRRWIQGPVTKVFVGSNPIPRT